MDISASKEKWAQDFGNMLNFIANDPKRVSLLITIHNSLIYYAGYVLKWIEDNLNVFGSVTAEHNSLVNVVLLEKGSSWSIVEHIAHCFTKQQYITKKYNTENDALYMSSINYISVLGGFKGMDDVKSKNILTMYAYKQLFMSATKR